MTRRVLLIDDDAMIREITALALTSVGGFDVTEADSGEAGIREAVSDPPDAILLDVMMSGLDGPSTLQRLRAEPQTREVPVVFMTAKLQPAEVSHFEQLGVHGVIAKPFDPMMLADELSRLLGW